MSVYKLVYDIKIGDLQFGKDHNKIISVNINKDVESFTNTAIIRVPRKLKKDNEFIFNDLGSVFLKRGDNIDIKLGYINGLNFMLDNSQFTGFISRIEIVDDNNVDIHCEDQMYFLKKVKLNFSRKSISLKDLGAYVIEQVNKIIPNNKISFYTAIDLDIKNLTVENITALELLDYLQTNYLLKSFFIGNVLNIGINYNETDINNNKSKKVYNFSLINSATQAKLKPDVKFYKIINRDNLVLQYKEDVKYSIIAKIYYKNGDFKSYDFGDEDGEKREFVFYGDYDLNQISKLVENQINRLKYTGFTKGSSFITFGKPDINVLDIISLDGFGNVTYVNNNINSNESKNKSVIEKSSYLVDSVSISFDSNGFRQEIKLSNKISISEDSNSLTALAYSDSNIIKIDKQATNNIKPKSQSESQSLKELQTNIRDSKNSLDTYKSFFNHLNQEENILVTSGSTIIWSIHNLKLNQNKGNTYLNYTANNQETNLDLKGGINILNNLNIKEEFRLYKQFENNTLKLIKKYNSVSTSIKLKLKVDEITYCDKIKFEFETNKSGVNRKLIYSEATSLGTKYNWANNGYV